MNDIYQKQLDKAKQSEQKTQNLSELFVLISPNQPYNFDQLKQEITRLKYQELSPQVRKEKAELEKLITTAKEKAGEGSFAPIVDLLLETQKKITDQGNEDAFVQGQLTAYQNILEGKLAKEELQNLLNKQTELLKLEQHLANLQQEQGQQAQILQKEPLSVPSSSKN